MSLRHFVAGSPIMFKSSKENWVDAFNTLLDDQFTLASDYYTIREETFFASGSYQNVEVRINTTTDPSTGEKLGDDFKTLLFNSEHSSVTLGQKFYFDNNYFLAFSTTAIKSLVNGVVVRRCNNVLRWVDTNGTTYSEPCVIDYNVRSVSNRIGDLVLPEGQIRIFAQLNVNTKTINENQRFLFGNSSNWVCYRVLGGGLANFINNQTIDNNSAHLLELLMQKYEVNEDTDDIVNGIADYKKYFTSASLIVNNIYISPTSGSVFESGSQLYSVYLYNGTTQLPDSITITVSGSSLVPLDHYTFSASANAFSVINNKKYLTSPLLIECLSGSNIRIKECYLIGAW